MQSRYFWLIGLAACITLQSCSHSQPNNASSTDSPSQTNTQNVEIQEPRLDPRLAEAYAQKFPLSFQIKPYESQVLGYRHTYGVSLPPNYDQHPDRRYPVIFLLHGGHGTPKDMFVKGKVLSTLQRLYATNKLTPSIIITPDGYSKQGTDARHDPAYIDGPHDNMDTAIGDELVKIVQSRYRTLPAPKFWAIGGISSGAWGAVNIGLHHLDHFSVLVSHGGYFIDKDKGGPANSPQIYIKQLPPEELQNIRIYLDTGLQDKRFFPGSVQFHQELDSLGIANQFNEFPGAHTWRFWRVHLADSLTYIGKQFEEAGVGHVS